MDFRFFIDKIIFKSMFRKIHRFLRKLEHDPNIVPIRSWRIGLMILILLGALLALMTPLFANLRVPDFTDKSVIIPEIQKNVAFEGIHFLGGVILGYMFSHPAVGLTFGILKELVDWIRIVYTGQLEIQSAFKSFMDIVFWGAGGFVGYYGLTNIHYLFQKEDIRGLKDLTVFTVKKVINYENNNSNKNHKSNHEKKT